MWKTDQLQEKEKEITFIIDTVDDKTLQRQNYIALSESSEEEKNSSYSSSEKSYYSL